MVWGLEQVICEEMLGLLSIRRRRLWGNPAEVGRNIKEIEPGSSQKCVVKSAWQVATSKTLTAYKENILHYESVRELEHTGQRYSGIFTLEFSKLSQEKTVNCQV